MSDVQITSVVDYEGRHTVWILRGKELWQYDPHERSYTQCPPVPPRQSVQPVSVLKDVYEYVVMSDDAQNYYRDTRRDGRGDCRDVFILASVLSYATRYATEAAARKWAQEFLRTPWRILPVCFGDATQVPTNDMTNATGTTSGAQVYNPAELKALADYKLAELQARLAALTEAHEVYEFDTTTEEQYDAWLHEQIKNVRGLLRLTETTDGR